MKAQRLTMQAFGIWTELAENISVFDHKRRRGLSRSRRANLVSLLNQSFKIDVTLYISGKILFFKFDMEAESETSLLVNEDATIIFPNQGTNSPIEGKSGYRDIEVLLTNWKQPIEGPSFLLNNFVNRDFP